MTSPQQPYHDSSVWWHSPVSCWVNSPSSGHEEDWLSLEAFSIETDINSEERLSSAADGIETAGNVATLCINWQIKEKEREELCV